jgi:hypothetical protein
MQRIKAADLADMIDSNGRINSAGLQNFARLHRLNF